jgi:hypothetical protein
MTLVSLARKARHVVPGVAAVILVTIATGCSAGCSASVSIGHKKTGGTYSGHGVSLTIPDGWSRLESTTTKAQTGNQVWSEAFSRQSSIDLVSITAYATKASITRENVDKFAANAAAAVKGLFESAGGSLVGGPDTTTVGGMAGYRFETTTPDENGKALDSIVYMIWNGQTEYFFNCQHEASGSQKAEIERGCQTITSSFMVWNG